MFGGIDNALAEVEFLTNAIVWSVFAGVLWMLDACAFK